MSSPGSTSDHEHGENLDLDHDTLDLENSRSDEVAGDLFGDDSNDELAENSEMAAIAAMPKIPKRNRTANASASDSRRGSESEGIDQPTETNAVSEAEEAEPAPVDPKQAELDEINRKIDAALKSGRARRRKRTDEDDANVDEMIVELRKRMRDAAYRDIDDNKDRLPAIHKLSMLPDVVEELSKPPLYEAFLDNNIVESIRLWLEPLDDGSLPSLDIQNAMLESLGKLPIRRDHLRESGIGKIILFMSKCPRISEQNRHTCEQFVQQWSRMVLRLSADYRDRRIKETSVDSDARRHPAARPAVAGATRAPGGIQVESGSGKGAERATARIPQRVAANYNVMPVTSLSLSDNPATPNRTANDKYKRLMKVMNKGGRR
ncbi:Transcription factor iws1 [Coemansia sp. RSA 922]|nr:Transcription factor iws1 [Coemansia sp. RSA 922]